MRRIGKIVAGVVFGAITTIGMWYYGLPVESASRKKTDDQTVLTVRTSSLERHGEYTVKRTFVGQVEATRHSQIGFERSGRVDVLLVEEGDSVASGDSLARLDTDRLLAREAVLEARVETSRARLEQARLRKEKVRKAFRHNAVSEQEWDQARTEYEARRANLRRELAELERVQVDLRKSVLRAPFDANVVRRRVDQGEIVESGTPVFDLVEQGVREARIGVSEEALGAFTLGESGPIQVGKETVRGVVKSINPTQSTQTRTVDVVFDLPPSDLALRPGRTVTIDTSETIDQSGFWVPIGVLVEAERGLWACYVAVPKTGSNKIYRIEKRRVQLLHETEDRAYVRGTLSGEDRVVLTGVNRLVSGQTVRLEGL